MSGHSKFANIKHKKEKTDAQKGRIFTKIGRELAIAVKEGGSDPASNSKLRDAIAKAKANNMPMDNINRSIKKAAGELGSVNYEELLYEGYGPNGTAVIVELLTDNRNRTAAEIRHIFDRAGGSLGSTGCVAWMFDRKGVLVVEKIPGKDEDDVMMMALDAGASDFSAEEDAYEIITEVEDFGKVRDALEAEGFTFLSAELERIPQNTVALTDEQAEKVAAMIEKLEDHDDVQNVYHNAELPEEEEED
ncbi:MAG: YebC/PmpR family DNA-binding transcriptional regulator [Christensenellales bacterium]